MERGPYLGRKHQEFVADGHHAREDTRGEVVEAGPWWLQVVGGIFRKLLAVRCGANDTGKQRASGPAETGLPLDILLQRSE